MRHWSASQDSCRSISAELERSETSAWDKAVISVPCA